MKDLDILFVAEHSLWGLLGYQTVLAVTPSVVPVFWSVGDPQPAILSEWSGDWIVSFKSDLLLSSDVLGRAKSGGINFHPGPPTYRGVQGYVWALRNLDDRYGVTCHFMTERIDFGPIVDVDWFSVLRNESVSTLRFRAAAYLLVLLNKIVTKLAHHEELTPNGEKWSPHLYTYKDLAKVT